MDKKKTILILLDNPFTNDRRVYREAKSFILAGYGVTLLAVKESSLSSYEKVFGIEVYRIFDKDIFDIKKSRCFNVYAKMIVNKFEFNIIHANDQTMLNLAVKIKKLTPQNILVYDSHELFHAWPLNLSNFNSKWVWLKSFMVRKLLIKREFKNRKYIDYIITVNKSLADDLKIYFGFSKPISIVRNIPEKVQKIQKSNILREKFQLEENTKILVFIGANIYAKTLNLEQVIDEIGNKQDLALIIICAKNSNSRPIFNYVKNNNVKNVFFHDIISPKDIQKYLSSADIGLVPTWNKRDLSYWYALDNKLFEYIHAHIPVLATQQPEYINIVERYNCGVCVNPDNNGAYIDGLKNILKSYEYYKANTIKSVNLLCWENEEKILLDYYKFIENGENLCNTSA